MRRLALLRRREPSATTSAPASSSEAHPREHVDLGPRHRARGVDVESAGARFLTLHQRRVTLRRLVEETVLRDKVPDRALGRVGGQRGVVHVEPALVEILEFDPEEIALYELLLLAQLRLAVLLGPGRQRRRRVGAGALAHVGVVGDATGAAVFERLVSLDADAGFDEREEQNPQDPDDEPADEPVGCIFLLTEPQVERDDQLRERQHPHAHHHVQRVRGLHANRFTSSPQGDVLVRAVGDAEAEESDEVRNRQHRAVNDRESHRLQRRRVLLREDKLGGFQRPLGHVLRLRVFRHRLSGFAGKVQIRNQVG
mmetsp:Transcript_6851/g.28377  ORF Transcript_6851/g.28377 Transcript_6851/m.28377 type:complete len:312 (-) Transcript_6851:1780-2715(-)